MFKNIFQLVYCPFRFRYYIQQSRLIQQFHFTLTQKQRKRKINKRTHVILDVLKFISNEVVF